MRVAVTGGTGCLGQPLIEKLINNGFDAQLLVRPKNPAIPILERKVRVITGDLNSPEALDLLTKDCDIVFHVAGKVHSAPKTGVDEQGFYRVNVEGTRSLLEAAQLNRVKRVVFYSTVGVYGKDGDIHGDELSPCQPLSVYGKSKYLAEQLVLESLNKGGPEGVVLRFPVAYGPLDRGNVARLIGAIHSKWFFYFGAGTDSHSMISSKNTAEAAIKAALEPQAANDVFCVTDGQDYTLQEIVESICCALNTSWRPHHIPFSIANWLGKLGDLLEKLTHISFPINSTRVRRLSCSLIFPCQKAKRMLGYEPKETLIEGISREVSWLRAMHGWN